MAAKKGKKTTRKVKNLAPKTVTRKQAKGVKGGATSLTYEKWVQV